MSTAKTPAKPARQQPRNELQRQSILDAASRLFIDKGFGGTNINAIADALGVTRTAVYYYFQSKEAILEALTEEVTERAGRLATAVRSRGKPAPEEALRQLVHQHALLMLTHPVQFRVVERSESSLPEARRAAARNARHAVLDQFVEAIEEGVRAGVFQVPDTRVAAFAIIGMCNWSAWWYEPGATSADQVAGMLTEMALRSVLKGDAGPRKPASVAEAIAQMRDQLAILASLEASRSG